MEKEREISRETEIRRDKKKEKEKEKEKKKQEICFKEIEYEFPENETV